MVSEIETDPSPAPKEVIIYTPYGRKRLYLNNIHHHLKHALLHLLDFGFLSLDSKKTMSSHEQFASPNSFINRTVIVTGGAGAVGRAISLAFAKSGANVVVNDFGSSPSAQVPEDPRLPLKVSSMRYRI